MVSPGHSEHHPATGLEHSGHHHMEPSNGVSDLVSLASRPEDIHVAEEKEDLEDDHEEDDDEGNERTPLLETSTLPLRGRSLMNRSSSGAGFSNSAGKP